MTKRQQAVTIWGLILLGVVFLAIGVLGQKEPPVYYAHSLRNYQEADAVAGYPIATEGEGQFWTAKFHPELNLLTGIERYRLPMAREFEHSPMIGEITAAGNGLVLMTGDTVVLGHRLPNGGIVQTLYGGLSTTSVHVGELVPRSTGIGMARTTIRFEVYASDGVDLTAKNRLDVPTFLEKHAVANSFQEPLVVMKQQERELGAALEKLKLDAKSAEKLGEILGGKN